MKEIFIPIIILLLLLPACNSKPTSNFTTNDFEIGISKGALDAQEINEASGLVASVQYPSMFWTHNDSGDKARIFLINGRAKHKATFYLKNIKNRDWEDITLGPGPESNKNYLYIGEIGDNFAVFKYKYIYRIIEPVITLDEEKSVVDTITQGIDSIKFELPDGQRDTESIMIDPLTKNIYVFSKREEKQVNLYVLPYPQSTREIMVASFVMHVPFTKIVSAGISPDGKEVLIKNLETVYYWKKTGNESLEELMRRNPVIVPYIEEPQGEAIAFDRKNQGYYTISEEAKGERPKLMFYERVANK